MGVRETIASVITGWNLAAGTIEKCKLTDRFSFSLLQTAHVFWMAVPEFGERACVKEMFSNFLAPVLVVLAIPANISWSNALQGRPAPTSLRSIKFSLLSHFPKWNCRVSMVCFWFCVFVFSVCYRWTDFKHIKRFCGAGIDFRVTYTRLVHYRWFT